MQGNGLALNSVSIKDGRHSWVLPTTAAKKGAYFEGQNSHYFKVLQLKLNLLPATLVWELPL